MKQSQSNDGSNAQIGAPIPSWKVLIADSQPDQHDAVGRCLASLRHDGRGVECLSAFSAREATALFGQHPDIAVVLMDVGLDGPAAVQRLIEHMDKATATWAGPGLRPRVVLCTRDPDQWPERAAFEATAIDGYVVTAPMATDRLYGAVLSGIRLHASMIAQDRSQKGMARVMVSTAGIFELRSSHHFYFNLLLQINSLFNIVQDSLLFVVGDSAPKDDVARIRAASGRFSSLRNQTIAAIEDPRIVAAVREVFQNGRTVQTNEHFAFAIKTRYEVTAVAFIDGALGLSAMERQMIEIFRTKATTAFSNMMLIDELNASQKAAVFALARVAEYKKNLIQGHHKRIERLVSETAREMLQRSFHPEELDEDLVAKVGVASVLADIGMMVVPDQVMHSTRVLDGDSVELVRQHTIVGWEILRDAATMLRGRSILAIAAEVALSHHERMDGSGYPYRLVGDAIPISGRIVSVVDVFDALISDREHREAWTVDAALSWVTEESGRLFDPLVVKAFRTVVARIREAEPDWLATEIASPALAGKITTAKRDLRRMIDRITHLLN